MGIWIVRLIMAGIEGEIAATDDVSEGNWDRVLDVNLKGVWLCMRAELKQMCQQGFGSIVNTGSVAGVVAERGLSAYAAAKGGVIQLTRTAAVEYAGLGIRINVVCPGTIMTPMVDRTMDHLSIDAIAPGRMQSSIMRKVVEGAIRTRPGRDVFYG